MAIKSKKSKPRPKPKSPITPEVCLSFYSIPPDVNDALSLRSAIEKQIEVRGLGAPSGTEAGFDNLSHINELSVFFQPYDFDETVVGVEKIMKELKVKEYDLRYQDMMLATKGRRKKAVARPVAPLVWERVWVSDLARAQDQAPFRGWTGASPLRLNRFQKQALTTIMERWFGATPPVYRDRLQHYDLASALLANKKYLTAAQIKTLSPLDRTRPRKLQ